MKNVPSFEVQHNGTSAEAGVSSSTPPKVIQRQRKVGFALSALLSSIGLAGCHSTSSAPEVTSYQTSPQNFGESPEGLIISPMDPHEGFLQVGNSLVHVIRSQDGWISAPRTRTRSIMNDAPDRFGPMMEFLARNNLSREDWLQISETYSRTEIIDELASVETSLLRALNEFAQNELHKENFDVVLRNYNRCLAALALSRKLHNIGEFSLEDLTRLQENVEDFELSRVDQPMGEETPPDETTPEAIEHEPTVEAPQAPGN